MLAEQQIISLETLQEPPIAQPETLLAKVEMLIAKQVEVRKILTLITVVEATLIAEVMIPELERTLSQVVAAILPPTEAPELRKAEAEITHLLQILVPQELLHRQAAVQEVAVEVTHQVVLPLAVVDHPLEVAVLQLEALALAEAAAEVLAEVQVLAAVAAEADNS